MLEVESGLAEFVVIGAGGEEACDGGDVEGLRDGCDVPASGAGWVRRAGVVGVEGGHRGGITQRPEGRSRNAEGGCGKGRV